jgi:ureidoglycolate lyase
MKELAWKKLSAEAFAKFGTYASIMSPVGPKIGAEPIEFYRDMVQSNLGVTTVASFGVCRVVKRPFILDVSEYHNGCCEIVLPLEGDVLMHVAPAVPEREFPFDQVEVFLVPRGTLCCLRPGVWHHAPFAFGVDAVSCLVALPERTYMNDCAVYPFPAEKQMKIVSPGV